MTSIARKPVPSRPTVDPAGQQDERSQDRSRSQDDEDPKNDLLIQEFLLREISSRLGTIAETSIHELRLLHSVSDRLSLLEDSKVEFVWNAVLQTIGIIFVIIFGVFAVLAYNASEISNRQSFEANQLSLLAFCNQAPYAANGVCLAISQQAVAPLTSLATAVLGSSIQWTLTATSTPEPVPSSSAAATSSAAPTSSSLDTSTSITRVSTSKTNSPSAPSSTLSASPSATIAPASAPHSSQHLSNPAIAGIVVGVFSLIMSIGFSWFSFRAKFKRRDDRSASPATYDYLPVPRREV